jgi:hypothetical protein
MWGTIREESVFDKFNIKNPIGFKTRIDNNWVNVYIKDIIFYYEVERPNLGDLWVYWNECDLIRVNDNFLDDLEEFIETFLESRGLPTYNIRYDEIQTDDEIEQCDNFVSLIVGEDFITAWLAL